MRIDALPTQGRKVTVSNDPRPRPAAQRKPHTTPADTRRPLGKTDSAPKRTVMDDARDRTAAKRDEAIATIGQAWRNPRKPAQAKAPGDKLKPDARQAAHDAIKGAYRRNHK
ncbi:hypothetical protein BA898_05760 [Spiribacter roseus]|nr:hypothetical protein BA898_05760 [Spiribacter roseus]